MKNKKLTVLAASLAIVGVAGAGLTYAYFTDIDTAKNTITMGNLDIKLTEPGYKGEGPENLLENVKPGVPFAKDPTVEVLEGSGYVRVKLDFTGSDEEFTSEKIDELVDSLNVDEESWKLLKESDGVYYFYYGYVLTSEDDPVTLFEEVMFPEKWGNEIAKHKLVMNITAEAIQSDGFAPSYVDDKYGWYYSDGTEVTPENFDIMPLE